MTKGTESPISHSEGGLDVEALRELAHKEYEIAKLLGPDDGASQRWLDYVEQLVKLTDSYLASQR